MPTPPADILPWNPARNLLGSPQMLYERTEASQAAVLTMLTEEMGK